MLQVSAQSKIFLAIEAVDFRKGIDGLSAVCRQKLESDPFGGAFFIFCNRRRTALRILAYDGQGYWLCTKRLSRGKFYWWPTSNDSTFSLSPSQLQVLLWNGNPMMAQIQEFWRKVS